MIPDGWTRSEISKLVAFKSGGTPSKSNTDFWGDAYPWVSAKDLKFNHIKDSIDKLSNIGFQRANKALPGDILILVRGMTLLKDVPVGKVVVPLAFNQDIKALTPNKVHGDYFLYCLRGKKRNLMRLVDRANHGTGRLSTDLLGALPILLPPLAEQKRIAEIISTWDRAIETTEKLITNSEAQKKALMQQLLTGKRRLPGFSGEWQEMRLDQAAHIIVSNVDKKTDAGEQPVRLCNYMDVYRADQIANDMPFMRATATPAQIVKFGLKVGDVLITKDSETPDDIAVPSYVASTAADLVCGYHLAIIRPKKPLNGRFLKFYFDHPHTRYFFSSRANGATRFGLTVDTIETAPILLPSFAEQERISEVIGIAENKIAALRPIVDALRAEKSALMQQLLTGKRRVKVKGEAPAA